MWLVIREGVRTQDVHVRIDESFFRFVGQIGTNFVLLPGTLIQRFHTLLKTRDSGRHRQLTDTCILRLNLLIGLLH